MSEHPNSGAAQLRADVPEAIEQESVRTTIVGGRPPGSGQPLGQVPRGLEILLKKAAVDSEFRNLLLDNPIQAAESIELTLEPVELTMLQTFPKEHLSAIIDRTEVPTIQRRTFLGNSAIAMLLLLTGGVAIGTGCKPPQTKGIRPDDVLPVKKQPDKSWEPTGSRPDELPSTDVLPLLENPCPEVEETVKTLPEKENFLKYVTFGLRIQK